VPDAPDDGSSARPAALRWVVRAARTRTAFVLWVVLVTLVLVPLLFRGAASVGPGTFEAHVGPALRGTTLVDVPPIGSIQAPTHRAPVQLGFELREVDVLDALDPANRPGIDGIEAEVRDDLPGAVRSLGLQLAGVSGFIGLVAAGCFPGRRTWWRLAAGVGLSLATVTVLVAPAAIGFDAEEFETNYELSGPLGSAQTLLARVGSLQTRFGSVESRTQVLSEKIAGLYSSAISGDIARSDGEVVLLHVSDLHLNSVGLSLAKDLAKNFEVDAVIDTGDITSFGFEPEAAFVDLLADFDVPYYLVAGNHDSSSVRARLAAADGVTLLDDDVAEVGDVTILGVSDPTETALRTIPKDEINRTYRAQFPSTERLVAEHDPDLLMVHNPVQIRPVLGEAPAAAAGHVHTTSFEIIDGTAVAVVGSSGATGVGNLIVEADEPYRFELLRFVGGELVAVDQIELQGAGGDFVLHRLLVDRDAESVPAADDDITRNEVEEPSLEQVEAEDPDSLTSTSLDQDAVDTTVTTPTTGPGG
jgi:Icc-related predicted phosphoesterase